MRLELKDFESCKTCLKLRICQKPCHKFLNDKKMKALDKMYFNHKLTKDLVEYSLGIKNTKEFIRIKKQLLEEIQLNQVIQYATEEEGFREGKVVQKTNNFIAVRKEESKYVSIINFLDIYTKDVAITAY